MVIYGYARVALADMAVDAQTRELSRLGCQTIFTDEMSGAKHARPGLVALFEKLQPHDLVIVTSLDRLARSINDLVQLIEKLRQRGAVLRSHAEQIDTASPRWTNFYATFSLIANFDQQIVVERTRLGLKAARANGRLLGRPAALTSQNLALGRRWLAEGSMTQKEIADKLGVSESTWRRQLARDRVSETDKDSR